MKIDKKTWNDCYSMTALAIKLGYTQQFWVVGDYTQFSYIKNFNKLARISVYSPLTKNRPWEIIIESKSGIVENKHYNINDINTVIELIECYDRDINDIIKWHK